MHTTITQLLASEDPAVRYKVLANVLGTPPDAPELCAVREEVRASPRAQALLSERGEDGTIPHHPYRKWVGAHWVLSVLADIGYPPGDPSLLPLRERVLSWLLSETHVQSVPAVEGRARRCASQEGNALWALITLGLDDERVDSLARNLLRWQWPDGGWNCDRKPEAVNSSFHETLLPLRALALYGRHRACEEALEGARRAAEVFLKRRLFRRQRDGEVMSRRFLLLHYPSYWRYDLLIGLRVLAEAGFLGDPRCADALDLLESRRLPGGGFPADEALYRMPPKTPGGRLGPSGMSLVRWGVVSAKTMNEFVTADALYVLRAAGRLR